MSYSEPPPPSGGQSGYGGGYAQTKTSQKAVWALVTGLLGICCGISAVVGLVLGLTAKKDIDASNGALTGRGLAQAGFVLGVIGVALWVLYIILVATGHGSFYFSTSS